MHSHAHDTCNSVYLMLAMLTPVILQCVADQTCALGTLLRTPAERSAKGRKKDKSTPVAVGYERPWIDQCHPGP